MTGRELESIADGLTLVVKDAIRAATSPLMERIVMLEARAAVPGPAGPTGAVGPTGRDGRDGTPGLVGPPGPAGEKGLDGLPGSVGQKGEPGVDGAQGPPGPAGEKGQDGADGLAGPAGRDGADGLSGAAGRDGIDGKDGAPGPRGEKGLNGVNGRDGKDGVTLGVDDLSSVTFDGERTATLTFTRGESVVSYPITFAVPVYRDVWAEGTTYQAGDLVTWGGSMWIAKAETTAKPGLPTAESRAWKLCVKAGRDGKAGPQGKSGPSGLKGDKGDPGPERW
jgi:integrin beta 3